MFFILWADSYVVHASGRKGKMLNLVIGSGVDNLQAVLKEQPLNTVIKVLKEKPNYYGKFSFNLVDSTKFLAGVQHLPVDVFGKQGSLSYMLNSRALFPLLPENNILKGHIFHSVIATQDLICSDVFTGGRLATVENTKHNFTNISASKLSSFSAQRFLGNINLYADGCYQTSLLGGKLSEIEHLRICNSYLSKEFPVFSYNLVEHVDFEGFGDSVLTSTGFIEKKILIESKDLTNYSNKESTSYYKACFDKINAQILKLEAAEEVYNHFVVSLRLKNTAEFANVVNFINAYAFEASCKNVSFLCFTFDDAGKEIVHVINRVNKN